MIIILCGLPKSGKKTLAKQLQKYGLTFYGDFYKEEITEIDNSIFTNFTSNLSEILKSVDLFKTKLIYIFMSKAFFSEGELEKNTENYQEYSEHFGIDIKYLYEQDAFNINEEKQLGNFFIIKYDYNFEVLEKKIDDFLRKPPTNFMLEALTELKKEEINNPDISQIDFEGLTKFAIENKEKYTTK
jgi:cytidylate kinase